MVQTRSKYRLLNGNQAAIVTEERVQPPSSTPKPSTISPPTNHKKKQKKVDVPQVSQPLLQRSSPTPDLPLLQPLILTTDLPLLQLPILTPDLPLLQPPISTPDLPPLRLLKSIDYSSDSSEEEDLIAPFLAPTRSSFDSSESDDDNAFDNSLYLRQKKLIDAYDSERENDQLDDINTDTIASESTLFELPDSWPIEKGGLQWTKTKKGKDCLIMGNFSYIHMSQSEQKKLINFRCQRRDRKCGAVIHLNLITHSFIDTNDVNHNHPPDQFAIKQKVLNHEIDKRISSEPTSVLKIVERVYAEANLTDEEQLHIRLPKAAANTFYKKRARRYPAHPKTQDFDIPESYNRNNRGEEFIIYDVTKQSLDGRLLMFSTLKLLAALFNSDIILCDGTFKTRPLLFQQVYVFMGRFHGETVPLVWCLSSSRTQLVYDAIWRKLKKIAKQMKMEWKMQKCMMDFERAVINSFHKAFPNIDLKCCWYHFTQALWRKIQKLGLAVAYETDPLINSWLKQFMGLPLISKELIGESLQLLKNTIPSTDNQYYKFIRYFEKEYMLRTSIDLWHHGSSDMKTNNSLEGYNFRLLCRFGLHPSIWQFIHYLKDEEALVSHRITHLGGGSGITSSTLIYVHMQSNRKAKENKKQLLHLEDLFNSKFIGLKQYLKSASLMVGKVVGQNTNMNNVDQIDADAHLINDENAVD